MTSREGQARKGVAKKAPPAKKAGVKDNRSNNKGGYTLRDDQAIKRFTTFLNKVIDRKSADEAARAEREGRRPRPLTNEDIAYATRLPDGTGGLSKQTVGKLRRGIHGPQVRSLKGLARALHGYTTYEELSKAAGLDASEDTRPLPEKMRQLLIDEGIPGHVIEETVGFMEFRIAEHQQPNARRKAV